MITVHHLENSRSQRVLWCLEELGLPYAVRRYERDPRTLRAPPELTRVHPLGKAPVIEDEGRVVAETGAILEHLSARAGGALVPEDPGARARCAEWLHYAEGSAMPPLVMALVFARLPAAAPWVLRPLLRAVADRVMAGFVRPDLDRHAAYWEGALAVGPYFCGESLSLSDIAMSFPVEAAAHRARVGPNARGWLARIHARPDYARALAAGGPYAYA